MLPKKVRNKYGIAEGSRLILREYKGQIILIPVSRYARPTKALYRSVMTGRALNQPKEEAREYVRKKLLGEFS